MSVKDDIQHVAYNMCQIVEPRTMEEALASHPAKEWKAAADSEYESLMENETWVSLAAHCMPRRPCGVMCMMAILATVMTAAVLLLCITSTYRPTAAQKAPKSRT